MKLSTEEKSYALITLTGAAMQGILAGKAAFDIQLHFKGMDFAMVVADQAVAYAKHAVDFLERDDAPPVPPPAAKLPAPKVAARASDSPVRKGRKKS